tara:strand:+ start:962 stop:1255 length:294 start_codon:yes stop_codon:yes gene_type:complete
LIELEGLNPNWKAKKIELGVEVEFEPDTIYVGAEIDIENLFIDQLNLIWLDYEAIPNMYEEVLITFQNMELLGRIIGKFYHVDRDRLHITVTLKLQE